MEKCTILMCTYNAEQYIFEQLESLRKQTYPNIQIIVYDDKSTDETTKIILSYLDEHSDINLVLHVNDNNSGGANRNFQRILSDYSKEKYVCFCDQDDIWDINKISILMRKMLELESEKMQPYLVCHNCTVIDSKGSVLKHSKIADVSFQHIVFSPVIQGCCMMLNHAALEKMNIENAAVSMHDWYASLVVASCGHIEVLDEELIKYRQHGKNQVGYNKKSLYLSIRYALNYRDKIKKYELLFQQLYSVSEVVSTSNFLRLYHELYSEKKHGAIIRSFFKYGLLNKNIHGLYQSFVSYKALIKCGNGESA